MLPLPLLPSNMVPKGLTVHSSVCNWNWNVMKCNYGPTMHMLCSIITLVASSPKVAFLNCYCYLFISHQVHHSCELYGSNSYIYMLSQILCARISTRCKWYNQKFQSCFAKRTSVGSDHLQGFLSSDSSLTCIVSHFLPHQGAWLEFSAIKKKKLKILARRICKSISIIWSQIYNLNSSLQDSW